jgi:hypothetical protein
MMGMHSEDVVAGGSVVAGAESVTLAELSLLVAVPWCSIPVTRFPSLLLRLHVRLASDLVA